MVIIFYILNINLLLKKLLIKKKIIFLLNIKIFSHFDKSIYSDSLIKLIIILIKKLKKF
jgi:hypothetical protein